MPAEYRQQQTVRAQLKLLRDYLDRLKDAGTYDQTTVIMTADHGFNQRFYPVCIVKEAYRGEDGFRIDSTPISWQSDYENLICEVTAGKSFSEAVRQCIGKNEVRTALNFRSSIKKRKTERRTIVEIQGEAKDPGSYLISKDEFLLDDMLQGRCV